MITLEELNALPPRDFVAALDSVFEHSPWVPERVAGSRPFSSGVALHEAMCSAVMQADEPLQLALIRAHPELAGRAAIRGELTSASISEQKGAGLSTCTPLEYERLQSLNADYRGRFDFPFVLAVKGHSPQSVIAAMERRVTNGKDEERSIALQEICRIARFRIADLIDESSLSSTEIAGFVRDWVDLNFSAECAFLAALVQVPTDNPPGDCAAHAAVAAQKLEDLGLSVERFLPPKTAVDAVGMVSAVNLVVRQRFGESGPCIALNAHGDVVPPGLGWTQDPYGAAVIEDATHGPVMYGRGVAVSKSDFATYAYALLALRALAQRGLRLGGSVELHLTYDEETGGDIGPRWLLEQGHSKPDYAIGAGFSYAVTSAHNGCLHLEVTIRGRQGHAAMPETGVDALAAATRVLADLYESREALKSRSSKIAGITHPTLNVGLIHGGINTNVVPDRVTFRIDRRIIPEESPAAAEAELRTLIERSAGRCPGIGVEIRRILLALPLVRLPGSEKLTEALRTRGAQFFDTGIGEHGVPLYTDARHYTAAGIPTVLYGAGPRTLKEANGHAADECLRLNDLRGATATVACALADLLGAAPTSAV